MDELLDLRVTPAQRTVIVHLLGDLERMRNLLAVVRFGWKGVPQTADALEESEL